MDMTAQFILFDSDGTLIDSTAAILRCWQQWGAEFEVSEEAFAEVSVFGRPVEQIVSELLSASLIDRAARRYEQIELNASDSKAFPGVPELLHQLPIERWAVVTSACRQVANARLRSAGLHPGLVVTADDVSRAKPCPEPYLLAAQKLGATPEQCLVVEDAPAGLQAARAAGMRALAVATTHHPDRLSGAEATVASLADVEITTTEEDIFTVRLSSLLPVPVTGGH